MVYPFLLGSLEVTLRIAFGLETSDHCGGSFTVRLRGAPVARFDSPVSRECVGKAVPDELPAFAVFGVAFPLVGVDVHGALDTVAHLEDICDNSASCAGIGPMTCTNVCHDSLEHDGGKSHGIRTRVRDVVLALDVARGSEILKLAEGCRRGSLKASVTV